MESKSQHRTLQFNSQVLLLIVLVVAVALAWWRTNDQLQQSRAQIDAMRRSQKIEAREPKDVSVSIPRQLPANRIQTPKEFIIALREIEDWYEFADHTADPFAETDVADDAIPMLVRLLVDRDPEVRTRALATLGKINRNPDVVVPVVIPLLKDEHANVRWHAAFALGQFGDEARRGIQPLTTEMNDDLSPIATFAATMLRQIDPTIETEARLIELLSNPIEQNRDRAIGALADLETPAALDALVRRYRNEDDPKLRDRLARTIANLEKNVNRNTAEQ